MPELPEVETTVRGLERVLKGRRIERVEARRADLRRAFPKDLGQRLTGARVTGLGRRAKYGLIHTDRDDTMVFHLGMSGSWRIDHASLEKHDHLLLETEVDALGRGMLMLNGAYARYFNWRYDAGGHLFERKYRREAIAGEEHFLVCFRYIAQNPVKAGLCKFPEEWEWGSAFARRQQPG